MRAMNGYVRRHLRLIVSALLFCGLGAALSACNDSSDTLPTTAPANESGDSGSGRGSAVATDAFCDPFGAGQPQSPLQGAIGTLAYLPNGASVHYSGVMDFEAQATPISTPIYLTNLDVATEEFSQGFTTGNGILLSAPDGSPLIEYFSLHIESVLKLGPNDQPGYYQFAVAADDGAIVQIDQGSGAQTLINDDGVHPTKLGCATTAVQMNSDTELPIQVDYFQGPRYNIALMLLWRKVDPSNPNAFKENFCGQDGNSLFFDYSKVPSVPNNNWKKLLADGWSVVPAQDYYLPIGTPGNPCGAAPQCFTDTFTQPAAPAGLKTAFTLTHAGVNPGTVVVDVDNNNELYTYDSNLNQVTLASQNCGSNGSSVQVAYCLTADSTPPPTPPTTTITSMSPDATITNQTTETFNFTSSVSGSTFLCSLDGQATQTCSSPIAYSSLADGQHTFMVWAVSPGGTQDPSGASYEWTVDTVPPVIGAMSYSATTTTFTVTWTTSEPTTGVLDWGLYPGDSNIATDGVVSTDHTVTVSGLVARKLYEFSEGGCDVAGNCATDTLTYVETQ